MLDARLQEDSFQKIARTNIQLELVTILFLERYQKLLYALEQRGSFDPSINLYISKLLLVLSSILNIRLQKYKLYCSVNPKDFRPYLSSQFVQTDPALEYKLNHTLQLMKKLIIYLDPSLFPNSLYFLNELTKFYTRKRRLFPQMHVHPSPPWLHPTVRFFQSSS